MRVQRLGRVPATVAMVLLVASVALGAPTATGGRSSPRLPDHPAPIGVLPSDLIDLATHARGTDAAVPVSISLRRATDRDAVGALVGSLGGRVVRSARATIEATVPPAGLVAVGTDTRVLHVDSLLRPFRRPAGGRIAQVVGANVWTAAGVGGVGVRIGIIDDFGGIADLLGDEIPNRVHFWCWPGFGWTGVVRGTSADECTADWSDEHGTAVVETLASIAPQAELFLASAGSYAEAEEAIDWFAAEGVRIVNASFGAAETFQGPGDGTYSTARPTFYATVDHAVAHGMLWVGAAGNENEGAYAATFDGGGGNPLLHDFGTGADTNGVYLHEDESAYVALRWDDSWQRPVTDLDLVVYEPNGIIPVATSMDTNAETGEPTESVVFTADAEGVYRIAVARWNGPPARFELNASATLRSRTDSPSLGAPSDTRNPGALIVGAVRVDAPDFVEWFSSHGPTADGRTKPDVVAPDCGETATFGPFCGTSQSTPVVAGVAALLLAADPRLADPASLADAVRATGLPVPYATAREVGAGLVHLGPVAEPRPVAGERLDLAIDLPAKPVRHGDPVTARVTLPTEAAGRRVAVQAWRDAAWLTLASGVAGGDGSAAIRWIARRSDLVRAALVPVDGGSPGESDPAALTVVARISIASDAPTRTIPAGSTVRYAVTVEPPVHDASGIWLAVDVRFGSSWKSIGTVGPTTGSGSRWTFDVRWTRGLWRGAFFAMPPDVDPITAGPFEVNAT